MEQFQTLLAFFTHQSGLLAVAVQAPSHSATYGPLLCDPRSRSAQVKFRDVAGVPS